MRGLSLALGLAALAGCAPAPDAGPDADDALAAGAAYVDDASYRRRALEASLTTTDNDYARRRLRDYTEQAWGALPEWNPPVRPALEPGATSAAAAAALAVEATAWEPDALRALGREAFFRYPTQLAGYLGHAVASPAAAARYGLWRDGGRLGGVVWATLPDGREEPSFTCSTCHASDEGGRLVEGRNNARLDLGALLADVQGGLGPSWGPGRLDVTSDGLANPTVFADLRAVRSQVELQRAAAVRNSLVALAIRIETLVITSLDASVRPPRKLSFALALYLWSLEPAPVAAPDAASGRGAAHFAVRCAGCHAPPGYSGAAVPLAVVGTDPAVGASPERGTGRYRVPSLRGVGDRHPLFAGGSVRDLDELLDPARTAPGHPFGLDLGAAERSDLLAFLRTL